jgi:hypothetical protein
MSNPEKADFIVFATSGAASREALGAVRNRIEKSGGQADLLDESADALLVRSSEPVLRELIGEFEPHIKLERNTPGALKPL